MSSRPQRRAKLANVDYAVLFSGQQIPDLSSDDDESSDDEYVPTRRRPAQGQAQGARAGTRKRRRTSKAESARTCFICRHASRNACTQCELCHRWFHGGCRPSFAARSELGNASCHECMQESLVQAKNALPRARIDSLADVVAALKKARRIVVVAGAGMSVSCGIPDFRSKDGIYAMVKKMHMSLPEPECLFHMDYFRDDPSPFFQVVKEVFASSPSPSFSHHFLKKLQDDGKLLRVYSQNVDGLEEVAGVTKYVPCHGSLTWSSCMRCSARVLTKSLLPVIQAGVIPTCSAINCRGVLKPEITFFGEKLSDRVSASITQDRLDVDLVLVIGTSLKVSPVAEIPSFVPCHVPQIVINKTPLKKKRLKADATDPEPFDLQLLGDCDTIVRLLCDRAGWVVPHSRSCCDSDSDDEGQPAPPRLTIHKDRKRICVDGCHCEGLADGDLGVSQEDDEDDSDVVCDQCGKMLDRGFYRCLDCFDVDICAACYPQIKQQHFQGRHTFARRN